MILDSDKKEEEAARDRPDEYIRAQHGERAPPRSESGRTTSAVGDGSSVDGGVGVDMEEVDSEEEQRAVAGPSSPRVRVVHAQDLEEAERQERRRQQRIWTAASSDSSRRGERTSLLPPTYREATRGLDKRKRRRMWLWIAFGAFVVFLIVLVTEMVDGWYIYKKRVDQGGWERGGLDGKGTYDPDWSFHYPALSEEINLQNCDLFSDALEVPPWSAPITTGPIYRSHAIYTFPADAAHVVINARGSALHGEVMVLAPDQPDWDDVRNRATNDTDEPPSDTDIVVVVQATFRDPKTIAFHSCQFGKGGTYGVSLVGKNDDSIPRDNQWDNHYLKWSIVVVLPRHVRTLESPTLNLGTFVIKVVNMQFSMSGDLDKDAIRYDEFNLTTTNKVVTINTIRAGGFVIDSTGAPIIIQDAETDTKSLVLQTSDGRINCQSCRARIHTVVHNTRGSIRGSYGATLGMDVVTTSGDIEGTFSSPKIFLTNNEGDIKGSFSGLEFLHEDEYGGLSLTTGNGDIDVQIDCASGREPHDGVEVLQAEPDPNLFLKLLVFTGHGDIRADLNSLPIVSPVILSLTSTDGEVFGSLPDNYQGDIEILAPRTKSSFISWPPGGGSIERRLDTSRAPDKVSMKDELLEWRGSVVGNVTQLDEKGKTSRKGWWNIALLTSAASSVVLDL